MPGVRILAMPENKLHYGDDLVRDMTLAILVLLLCSIPLVLCGCQRKDAPVAPASAGDGKSEADRQFQRKLECGKFLAHIEGSQFGPDIHSKKGILPLNPVVFYSPSLNTCLYLNRVLLQGQTVTPPKHKYEVEHDSVEDLLTGRTIEEQQFDLTVPEEANEAKLFEDKVMKTYGGKEVLDLRRDVP
jgi:hypothetical protein